MKSWFVDDFDNYNTCTILGSKQPTDLEKERIFKVIEYIATNSVPNIAVEYSNKFHNIVMEIARQNISYIEKYNSLKSKIEGCETNECLLMHVAKTYGLTPKSLLMETIAIHSRIKKLDHKDAWFDNFSLNSFLLQLTTIVYSEYDDNKDKFVKSITFNDKTPSDSTIKSKSKNENLSGGDSKSEGHMGTIVPKEFNFEEDSSDTFGNENMRNVIYNLEMIGIKNKNQKFDRLTTALSGGNLNLEFYPNSKNLSQFVSKYLKSKSIESIKSGSVKTKSEGPMGTYVPKTNLLKSGSKTKTKLTKPFYPNLENLSQFISKYLKLETIKSKKSTKSTKSTKSKLLGGESTNQSKINKSVKLTNPMQLLFHLGNNYRTFIEFGTTADKIKDNDKATELLDKLVEKYPYYTGCTHGCDVFTSDFRDKSVSIYDIHEFCQRYPFSIVGYILNTKTYKSGKGQHWMALLFKSDNVYLICSQASGFNAFEEKTLEQDLEKCGFSKEWNTKTIQIDHSSCGLYSVLSNLSFIMNGGGTRKPDIKKIVDMIGKEAKGINEEGIYTIKQKLAGFNK